MLYTIGHGNMNIEQLAKRLQDKDIGLLVDVRSYPGSRRNPDVLREFLARVLPLRGIDYRHEPRLGGRRKAPEVIVQQDNWWRVNAFANYAAHTRTPEFINAYVELMEETRYGNVAIMCGEPCWWRCHRRIISDLATVDGHEVKHIMPNGTLATHGASEWANAVYFVWRLLLCLERMSS